MSKRSEAKRSRRKKRQSARDQPWIPERVQEELEFAADLEAFDARLIDRGWVFSDDLDESDASGVIWVWPASAADVGHDAERADATVVLLTPDDGGEIAHVVFVGTSQDYQFGLAELFEHIETIEAYKIGAPLPVFG